MSANDEWVCDICGTGCSPWFDRSFCPEPGVSPLTTTDAVGARAWLRMYGQPGDVLVSRVVEVHPWREAS